MNCCTDILVLTANIIPLLSTSLTLLSLRLLFLYTFTKALWLYSTALQILLRCLPPSSEENIIPGHVLGLTTQKKANSTRSRVSSGGGGWIDLSASSRVSSGRGGDGLSSLLAPGSPPEGGGGGGGEDSSARSSVSFLLGRRTLLLAREGGRMFLLCRGTFPAPLFQCLLPSNFIFLYYINYILLINLILWFFYF